MGVVSGVPLVDAKQLGHLNNERARQPMPTAQNVLLGWTLACTTHSQHQPCEATYYFFISPAAAVPTQP